MSPMAVEKLSSLFLEPVSLETSGSNHKRKSLRDPIKSSYMTREGGRSTHAKGVYTIDVMGNDVVALLEHLGLPHAHVIGHSMGGRSGLSIALNFPGKVKSLMIAAGGSGPAGKEGPESVPGLPFRLAFELLEMSFEGYVKHEICDSDTYFTPSFRKENPDKVKVFYQMVWSYHAKLEEYLRL